VRFQNYIIEKPYLSEKSSQFLDLILEIKINVNDPDIIHPSRFIWMFSYKGEEYKFGANHMMLSNRKYGYVVEWGLIKDGKVSTDIVGGNRNAIGVFSKVMSCMAIFLKQEKPEAFSMTAKKELARIYDTLWLKFSQSSMFKEYFYKDRKMYKDIKGHDMFLYHYSKTPEEKLSESMLISIIHQFNGTDIKDFI